MIERKSWTEFRQTQLIWWINRNLHLFGWTLVLETDKKTGEIIDVYPARTGYRGFPRQDEEKGFLELTSYLQKESQKLVDETHLKDDKNTVPDNNFYA